MRFFFFYSDYICTEFDPPLLVLTFPHTPLSMKGRYVVERGPERASKFTKCLANPGH